MKTNQNRQKEEPECCPKFEPALRDEKIQEWDNKKICKREYLHLYVHAPELRCGHA